MLRLITNQLRYLVSTLSHKQLVRKLHSLDHYHKHRLCCLHQHLATLHYS
jgi:hypothetical protein